MRRLLITLAVLGASEAVASGPAVYTWKGGAPFGDAALPANWQNGTVPTGQPTDVLVFGNASQTTVLFPTSLTIGSLTFNGSSTSYFLGSTREGNVLTLSGDVSTSPGFSYHAGIGLPVLLSSGVHTFNIEGSSLNIVADVSGSGSILKTGAGELGLYGTNSFSGGVSVTQGILVVESNSALGSGTLTINGGTLAAEWDSSVSIGNQVTLGALAQFGRGFHAAEKIHLTGTVASANTSSELRVNGDATLYLEGNITNGTGPTAYLFTGSGTTVLSGNSTYSGGTTVGTESHYGKLVFGAGSAIPATGLIKSSFQGYVGLADPSATPTFLSKIDPVNFHGVIGFDTAPGSPVQTFSGAINLSALSDPLVYVGTITEAALTGLITPPSGSSGYNFGGSGWLFLRDNTNPLADGVGALPVPRELRATTLSTTVMPADPLMLVISRGNNTYTGDTTASSAGILFDAPGALPAASVLRLGAPGSYVGFTEAVTDLTTSAIVTRVAGGTYGPDSVLGFDSTALVNRTGSTPRVVSNVSLATLPAPIYLGTASGVTLDGTITTTGNGTADYFFTGFNGGILTVNSTLSGAGKKVHIGTQSFSTTEDSVVSLMANNTYSGGTILYTGTLHLGSPTALGSGALSVEPYSGEVRITSGSAVSQVSNNIILQSGTLKFTPQNPTGLTLPGVVSGLGRIVLESSLLRLSGNNTFSGGIDLSGRNTKIVADSNQALGTGAVYLEEAAGIEFTSNAPNPVVGGLGGGWSHDVEGTTYYSTVTLAAGSVLTINQPWDESFAGNLQFAGNAGSLVKTGTGTLTLYGTNPYVGGTTINQGRLVAGATGALGSGTITINGGSLGSTSGAILTNPISFGASGGTLSGNGIVAGNITVGPNVALVPGESPGTLTFTGALTWAGGGAYAIDVLSATGAPGIGFDTIVVSGGGTLNITANSGNRFNLNLLSFSTEFLSGNVTDFNSSSPYSWQILSSSTTIGGFSASAFNIQLTGPGNFTNSLAGGAFSVSLGTAGGDPFSGSTAIFLNFTPVPEPPVWLLLAAGSGIMVWRRLRRRA
ncbi:MAG: autotransporter-associated beta strand repeat-containing protein [Verrucomicrobia bacterium]|nr:autotransporter-associated beta strand repeat-containing protein [Verrucomicrobiota bacterium]